MEDNTKKRGRPIEWTEERIQDAREELLYNIGEKGYSASQALREDGMPHRKLFYKWLDEDEEFRNNYVRARESREELYFDKILEIANTKEFYEVVEITEIQGKVKKQHDEDGNVIAESQDVQTVRKVTEREATRHREIRIDAIKWILGRSNPSKYGNKIDVTTDGEKINKVTVFELPDNNRE